MDDGRHADYALARVHVERQSPCMPPFPSEEKQGGAPPLSCSSSLREAKAAVASEPLRVDAV